MTAALESARRMLASEDEPTRVAAVHLLRDDFADEAAAARLLVDVLADRGIYVPGAARAALQSLGASAIPALLDGLTSENAVVRAGCVWALAAPQDAPAAGVARSLAVAAHDEESAVRHGVAAALGRVGPRVPGREELLIGLTRDAAHRVRAEAVRSLGRLQRLGAAGGEALAAALDDGQTEVRLAAVEALRAQPPTPALVDRVRLTLEEEPAEHLHAPLRALIEVWGG